MLFGDQLYDKKVTCPLCKHNYATKKVLSKAIRVSRVEGDFYTAYQDVNPVYYHVNVCSQCGFSFMEKTTPKISNFQHNSYLDEVSSRWKPREFGSVRTIYDAITACKLAIFCAQYMEEPARTIGGLCLQLVWLYRDLGDEEKEMRFLRDALDFYEYSFENDSSLEDNGKLTYLIGELHRRLGDDKQAVHYFNQVIKDKTSDPKYVKMARDQWGLVREEKMSS